MIDFGLVSKDYAQHRKGFPESFLKQLLEKNYISKSDSILDIGTGTGTIAHGLARLGMRVHGMDIAENQICEAKRLNTSDNAIFSVGKAEKTGCDNQSFDVVIAGQCWAWFDHQKAMLEMKRILKKNGRLIIANFDFIPLPGNLAYDTEKLIKEVNPTWNKDGCIGMYPEYLRMISENGFSQIETFSYEVHVEYTHSDWQGRMQAHHAVGASLDKEKCTHFASKLQNLLQTKYPNNPQKILHRVGAIIGKTNFN